MRRNQLVISITGNANQSIQAQIEFRLQVV